MSMPFPHTLRLIVAGIFALPPLFLLVTVAPFVILLSIPSLAILVRRKRDLFPSFAARRRNNNDGNKQNGNTNNNHPLLQHAVITGGSSGIGLSIALELAKRKCQHITLVARKEGQLNEAKKQVEEASSKGATTVRIVSVDVTNFEALEKSVAKLCGNNNDDDTAKAAPGPPTLLFNCAGYSVPLAFEDLTPSTFAGQVNVNYLGSVHVVKAFLPYMTSPSHTGGNIILTSSMSGQTGTFGYAAYSPTKFALRGFAECLSMELAAKSESRVNISLAYPPDTKTPGYEIENLSKPEECRLISESGGIWDAEVVGTKMVNEALSSNPSFDIYFGIDGWMLATLTSGMNPVTTVLDAIYQVSLMGLLRFVSLFYLLDFGRLTQNCHDAKKKKEVVAPEEEKKKKVIIGKGETEDCTSSDDSDDGKDD
eukprot:CAMPEP_0183716730 /NCGR_PEP_ID=MMETSP0737-20130205/10519_1 /TAXON_ID=385413 /ORGANISM="Thalassiosira miniscula, Strain CCMP1093" /LENGTH=423 /DNA_ID=CAMNT_0025946027 /DNA_START=48 /DNA_END=1319 /DNA_ORIENTATION=-